MIFRKREPDYKVLTLSNGATLYVLRISGVKTVGLGVHVNVGTRDEVWPKQAGLSHAMEHMAFQGTQDFPDSKALAGEIEAVGGMLNAYTSSEMTYFYNRLPSEEKERGLRVLSQQLRKSLFRQNKIDTEMKSIVEEMNRAKDNPQVFVDDKAEEVLYGKHPLAKGTLGLKESVSSFKTKDFLDWQKEFYHSSNFTFVAIGDIETAEAKHLFENYFPEKSSLPATKRLSLPVSAVPGDLTIVKEVEQAHVVLGALAPATKERGAQALRVFEVMLDGGMSFPLFQEIRDKRGLCYQVGAGSSLWSDAGIFAIYLGTNPARIEEAKKAIHEVISQVKNSSSLMRAAKLLLKGRLAFFFESPKQLIYSAGMELTSRGKLRGYKERLNDVESVTIEEVEEVVNRYLSPEKIIKVALLPKTSSG